MTAGSIVFNAAAPQSVVVTAQGGNTVTLTGPVTLGQNLTVNTDGAVDNNVNFAGTVNAATKLKEVDIPSELKQRLLAVLRNPHAARRPGA